MSTMTHRRGAAKSTGRQQAGRQQAGRQQGRTAGRRTTWMGSGTSDGQRGQAAGMERHPTKWTCSRTAGTSSRTAETDSTDTDNRHRHQTGSVDRQRGWAEGTGSRTAGTSSRTARRTAQTQTTDTDKHSAGSSTAAVAAIRQQTQTRHIH
jgi:hypothetical protein